MFYKPIEFIEVNIGKNLASQIPDWYTPPAGGEVGP